MTNSITTNLRQWLAGELLPTRPGLESITPTRAIQVHIDELVPSLKGSAITNMLTPTYIAFSSLVDMLASNQAQLMAALIISLRADENLETHLPDINDLDRELDGTPPELYVIDRNLDKFLWPMEEYVCPVHWPEVLSRCPSAHTTYHCRRPASPGRDEFSRFVQARQFPAELVLPAR